MKGMDVFTSSWELFLAILSMALIFIIPLFIGDALSSTSPKPCVGGPCPHKQYCGEAQIISINPIPKESGSYEIKFFFHAKETVLEEFAKPEDRLWSLLQKDFSSPQESFIKKYGIKIGKRFPCTMNVMTKGACTPVLFDFPTIDEGRGQ